MKILALITARGGSKRIPRKNIRVLGGQPLIKWSIDAVKGISDICDIFVSTDDDEIAVFARNSGASVPWLRPEELATDTASSVDVCINVLDLYEKENGSVDGLLLLQPTSPFRSKESVLKGITIFKENSMKPVVGVSQAENHPLHCFTIKNETMLPFIDKSGLQLRTQELPHAFVVNGAFYLITPTELRTSQTFFPDNAVPLIFKNPEEGIDIDTDWDWQMAEMVLRNKDSKENQLS